MRWMAPEIMDELEDGSTSKPTFASDIYSMACLMYEVLCFFAFHAPVVTC